MNPEICVNLRILTMLIGKKDITYPIKFEWFPDLPPVKVVSSELDFNNWRRGRERRGCKCKNKKTLWWVADRDLFPF